MVRNLVGLRDCSAEVGLGFECIDSNAWIRMFGFKCVDPSAYIPNLGKQLKTTQSGTIKMPIDPNEAALI